MLLLVFFAVPAAWHAFFQPPAPALALLTPGEFHPTTDQMSDLVIGTAKLHPFPGLVDTDGTVAANDDTTTPVYSPFTGAVTRILVKAGDAVKKGAPLMVVAASEAMQSESDLIAAADAARAAQAAAKNAVEAEARQHALFDAGSIALKDWHQAQLDLTMAQNQLQTANAALTAARGKLGILGFPPAQIAALERHAAPNISSEATLVAPISGTVLQRQVGVGQFLQAGAASPVFSIGDASTLWLVGNVREEDAPQMRVGAPVDVTLPAMPGQVFHAKLIWVGPAIDATTHRLAVRAQIANPDGRIKPAMFASLAVHTGGDRVSAAVPESAVIREGDAAHVWVLQKNGGLALRGVRIGRLDDGTVELLAGLKAGERFVRSGGLFVDSATQPN